MFLCFIATLCCLVPWATSHQHSNRRYLGNFIVMNFFWLLSIWQSKWYKNAKYHELKSFFLHFRACAEFWRLLNAFECFLNALWKFSRVFSHKTVLFLLVHFIGARVLWSQSIRDALESSSRAKQNRFRSGSP